MKTMEKVNKLKLTPDPEYVGYFKASIEIGGFTFETYVVKTAVGWGIFAEEHGLTIEK